ncbi:MAG: hypothetical protein ABIH35_02300 [Patescibacteria group bacterium]
MTGYSHMGSGWILPKLSVLVLLLGLILFLVWATRTLNKKDLKKLVVGLLGITVSSFFGMKRWNHKKNITTDWQGVVEGMCAESHADLETSADWKQYLFGKMKELK